MAARSRAPARQTPLIQQSPLSPPSPPRSTAPSFGGGRLFGRSRDRDICYKCRGSGHWAQDCPNDQGSPSPARSPYLSGGSRFVRSRNQDICYACGIRGHWAQDYPNGSLDEIGQDHCFNCNLPGHWARDCSSIRSPNRRAQDICYECGLSGHWAEDCPSRPGSPNRNTNSQGSPSRNIYYKPIPQAGSDPDPSTLRCPICFDTTCRPVVTLCLHVFCDECIYKSLRDSSLACPLCRARITQPPEPDAILEGYLKRAVAEGVVAAPCGGRNSPYTWREVEFSRY